MKESEVIDLIKIIRQAYPTFDSSAESVRHHFKYLRDFSFEAALENVEKHILTERFPPTIADIRGRLGDQMESQRSKATAAEHFARLDAWGANNTPPPEDYWESIKRKLRGEVGGVDD